MLIIRDNNLYLVLTMKNLAMNLHKLEESVANSADLRGNCSVQLVRL